MKATRQHLEDARAVLKHLSADRRASIRVFALVLANVALVSWISTPAALVMLVIQVAVLLVLHYVDSMTMRELREHNAYLTRELRVTTAFGQELLRQAKAREAMGAEQTA